MEGVVRSAEAAEAAEAAEVAEVAEVVVEVEVHHHLGRG